MLKTQRVPEAAMPAAPKAVALPQYTTTLVGRESEIAHVGRRLQDPNCRLLNLIGMGGIGKTRLAVAAASAHKHLFPEGVFFVSLQSVASADGILRKVAGTLDYEFSAGSEPTVQLRGHLQGKELLLILDNLEHLPAAPGLIADLLAGTSKLKLLATSREPLDLQDEWLFHVEGLPFPGLEPDHEIERYGAVQLFAQHAGRVRRDFSLAGEKAAVARICQLVQGMPLAIELAAKWRRGLPSDEIARELQHGLDMLATDLRDLPSHHRSMRAVFDHSWKLLSDEEQRVLMALAIFRGGFRREAAAEIAGASLAVLMSLVDKSILRVSRDGRYDIHELQRQYAEERLDLSPELKTEIRARHSAYYARFIDRPVGDFLRAGNQDMLRSIGAEIDNIHAAWNWAIAHQHTGNLAQAIQGLYWYTWMRSWQDEGERALRQAVEVLRDVEPTAANQITLGRALYLQGAMDIWLVRPARAGEATQESVTILRSLSAEKELAEALNIQGWAALAQGDLQQAKILLEESLALYEALDRRDQMEVRAFTYGLLGFIARNEGDFTVSEQWYKKALRLGRDLNDQRAIADVTGGLGRLALSQGNYARARRLCLESLAIAQAADIWPIVIESLHSLATIARATGDLAEARAHVEESLRVARILGRGPLIAGSLVYLGMLEIAHAEYTSAQKRFQQALEVPPGVADRRRYAAVLDGLGRIAMASGEYDDARRLQHDSLALHREINYRPGIMDNLVILASIALAQGNDRECAERLTEALQEALQDGVPPGILRVLAIAAELRMKQGDRPEALRLAALVAQHPATDAESKQLAMAILDKSEARSVTTGPGAIDWNDNQDELLKIGAGLLERLSPPPAQTPAEQLSQRELEVLSLVAAGNSNREIARELFLAVGTVKTHMHNIMQKLDASSRTQAVARARELGLL